MLERICKRKSNKSIFHYQANPNKKLQVESKHNEFFWTCPGQTNGKNCNIVVTDSFNRKYLNKENEQKYRRKLCILYAQENKAIRWCPAPDCVYCIENPSLTARTIKCRCTTVFCFRCGLEDHQPCECEQAANWQSKNLQESENTKWISVYTKPCPKCSNRIEKNQGCNHMTCKHPGCNYEFCWVCLQNWKAHQGNFYKCNKFEALSEVKTKIFKHFLTFSQEEKNSMEGSAEKEKAELEKYVFYFERFSNNERAFQISKGLHLKMEANVSELQKKLGLQSEEIRFLTEATETLLKTRKILKWTYAYSYYIESPTHKCLFEFHQKDLERICEDLNEILEMKYAKSIQTNQGVLDLKSFYTYKDLLTNVTYKCQKVNTR